MRFTARSLNRTLLLRQHLLHRTTTSAEQLVGHLVGVQAQENLSPFLGLAARTVDHDPRVVSDALADRTLVRMVAMRGTLHLLTADDALVLRQWTRPCQERERRSSATTRPGRHLDPRTVEAAVNDCLDGGPLPVKELGRALAERLGGVDPSVLAHLARLDVPLVQLPPRGQWRGSGGVVLQRVDRWLEAELRSPDPSEIVRRYLAAFGPATAADVTTWSGVPGLGPVLTGLVGESRLEVHEDPSGRRLYDVPGGPVAHAEEHAPVRLLGVYDNVWLSHADRDRVTVPRNRLRWAGANGGSACVLLVDGYLEGLWRVTDGRPEVVELFRALTAAERVELDEELDGVAAVLAV